MLSSSSSSSVSHLCSCSSPCQAPVPSPHNMSIWHWTCPVHSADCTWGVWHRSSGSGRSCCWALTPCPVDRNRSHPHQGPPCSCGCSRHCPVSRGLWKVRRESHLKCGCKKSTIRLVWSTVIPPTTPRDFNGYCPFLYLPWRSRTFTVLFFILAKMINSSDLI